ncbi:MAG: hypothetical protein HKM04_04755 [Legionellales bacterium]|nr:hypothetical protein [Legionellales bacterium]
MTDLSSDKINDLTARIKKNEGAFLTLIRERLGIIIHPHQKMDLHHTLLEACQKFSLTPEEYLHILTFSSNNSLEFSHLIAGITIGETYFFRDNNQMQLLNDNLLPELIQSKRERDEYTIRIWSAGCSTGEDIYTIAMMLCELIPDYKRWSLQLMGTDINAISLQKATLGRYTQWSMRTITDYFKNKYFTPVNHCFQISPQLRELVNFSYLNLNENTYPSILNGTNARDLILCCNVLIYFDNVSIANLMKKLEDCLVPGGYLLLGASDPVILKETELLQHHSQGLYFSRPAEKQWSPPSNPLLITSANTGAAKPTLVKTTLAPITDLPKHTTPELGLITKLMRESQWQEALNIIDKNIIQGKKTIFLLDAKATALANLGKLSLAIICCHESMSLDPSNKQSYFTHAMILLELNQLTEAETLLRKAIFFDHRFVEAHYQLGLLLFRCKNPEAGLKCFRNALSIAKNEKSDYPVSEFSNLTFKQLVTILENELVIYSKHSDKNNSDGAKQSPGHSSSSRPLA